MTDAVVLLHGIARTSASMRPMQRAMEAVGYRVLNLDYDSRHRPLAELVEAMHPAVSRFASNTPGALHAVGHSMGGLLLRAYLARHRPQRFGRAVMLGTPNNGSELADRLHGWLPYRLVFGPAGQKLVTAPGAAFRASLGRVDYPVGIVAGDRPLFRFVSGLVLPGPNDGKVTVESTRLDGMGDHLILHTSHTRLTAHPEAIAATLAFLASGTFQAPSAPTSCARTG